MNRRSATFAAIDLGASSGRVMRATVGPDTLTLTTVHRFPNRPVMLGDTLHWDLPTLLDAIRTGLAAAGPLDGIGVDTWGVDYGLLDHDGTLLGPPVHYRDTRTRGIPEDLARRLDPDRHYRLTGTQRQDFTTIHQLHAERAGGRLDRAARLLLIPDLIIHHLTGRQGTEITNASTTGLLDPVTRTWSQPALDAVGIDADLFAPLREPGDPAGHVPAVGAPVHTVASHDTASAVAAVPATDEHFAYISCGTWSLVGVELTAPVLSPASQQANFTNELGVDHTIRYHRNITGLWLLQECLRTWHTTDLAGLLTAAAHAPALRSVIDATDPAFLPPGTMPDRIAAACRAAGEPVPPDRPALVRCILDSLALAHRRAVHDAAALSGHDVDTVHIVGGGANNRLLCQLTADALGLPVIAGPVEATALGNALIQARAAGTLHGTLTDLRHLIATAQPLHHYQPTGTTGLFEAAERRLGTAPACPVTAAQPSPTDPSHLVDRSRS